MSTDAETQTDESRVEFICCLWTYFNHPVEFKNTCDVLFIFPLGLFMEKLKTKPNSNDFYTYTVSIDKALLNFSKIQVVDPASKYFHQH